MHTPSEVLDYWFGVPRGPRRTAWFLKNALFDETLRKHFLPLYNRAASGRLEAWKQTPEGALALVVLTDQFPRNLFRGSPRAFETDAAALATSRHILAKGWDRPMLPVERLFVYLPFEHSELLADQEQSLTLFKSLAAFPETPDAVEYSKRHWEIVERFGRFPHRNAALGRVSTPEEIEFLKQPGSGF
jgi:uncharacterized protein (DUF924 family)